MNNEEAYSKRLSRYVQLGGIVFPIIFILYGVAVHNGLASPEHLITPTEFIVLAFFWAVLGIIQFFSKPAGKRDTFLRLFGFYLLSTITLVGFTGVNSPFAMFWILLMLASYVFFFRLGIVVNVIVFAIIVTVDSISRFGFDVALPIQNIVSLLAVIFCALVMFSIDNELRNKRKELRIVQSNESVQKESVLTIVNNLTDAVISTNKDGVIVLYNAATLNLLDTNKSLIGKKIGNVLRLKDLNNRPFSLLEHLRTTRSTVSRDDLTYSYDKNDTIKLELTYSPIRSTYTKKQKSDSHDGYVIMLRDITKLKNLEEERDEFISVVSHELRTPITISEGSISNLQFLLERENATKDMISDAANTAHEQIVFLAKMVNDLSALSRAERNVGGEKELIGLKDLAYKLYNEYEPDASKKHLKFNLDLSPRLTTVTTSRLYLEELIQNFITNSIKYTQKGSIVLSFKEKNGHVTISVKDTGIGISKADQQKVFDKFYRCEDYRTRQTNGTGLGLYVANKLAQKLSTKIQLTSRINFGSTFSFTIETDEASKVTPS